ncbi:hypothetical protein QR680_007528 [Steinernema hermaphroditum]|uniref:Uncharacterized protein n=1 Tax=Steinernema hermaphroditum TaxID=289476 RepID=A0AA39IFM2_9BILA|nr:hypothetical protein QR680_007528 [Steinernema hermaphroditum]
MTCSLNMDVLAAVINEARQVDFPALAGVNEEWKNLLINSVKEEPEVHAYFYLEDDEWTYHFCGNRTVQAPDYHRHHKNPTKRQTVHSLVISGDCGGMGHYCSKDEHFPIECLDSTAPLKFKKLEILGFDGSLEGLPGNIQKDFEIIVINDSDLSDPSNKAFIVEALQSPDLSEIFISESDIVASRSVRRQLVATLESLRWDRITFEEFWTLGDDHIIDRVLENWMKEENPIVFSLECGLKNYAKFHVLWKRLAKLGEPRGYDIVIKHPKVEGLEAVLSNIWGSTISIQFNEE